MGMVWIDLTPEEMCNLMCGEPQEETEEIDADKDGEDCGYYAVRKQPSAQ
jgi:hypothetical protein